MSQRLGIGARLFGGAGVLAVLGKKDVQQAAPSLPTGTIAGMQSHVATAHERISR
jgi:hypothetical protein